ncbi:CHAD domain-containing protein [Rhodoluna sp.]|uniref:CHAD domain-containing protein n=1 Tax=Rhodoluna sp. TaxID=1969481 RepID=UPI0025CE917B|nr:CHAD domain-containing protein [Rhodoluna sp.]
MGDYKETEHQIRNLFLQSVAKMMAHKEFMLDAKAPEELHDFRVGLREVRSNLKNLSFLFEDKERLRALLIELSWIDDLISAVRDASVLRKVVGVKSTAQQKLLAEAINSPRCDEMFLELQNFLQNAKMKKRFVREFMKFAKPLFKHRYRELKKMTRDVSFKKSSDRKLHQLRIATKRVRYLGEVCILHTPNQKMAAKVTKLVAAQTMLGDFNDLVIARNWLQANDGDQQLDQLLANQQFELRGLMGAKLRF